MLGFLIRRKRMKGGLYFGPPGWSPTVPESNPIPHSTATTDDESIEALPVPAAATPSTVEDLLALLEKIHLPKVSAILPSLSEQLHDLSARRMRALVLNLLPTQPEFALPAALSHIAHEDILAGLDAIQKVIRAKRVLIVIDRHDRRTRKLWKRANKTRRYSITALLNRYPQAHSTILLYTLFAKRLPVGRSPVRVNRMIVDPVSAWALGHHLRTGQPFSQRPIQVFAPTHEHPNPRFLMAAVGEPLSLLCERLRIPLLHKQVILNGLLAGEEIDPVHFHIQPDTESITIRERALPEPPSPCFACGWCVDVCPTALNPVNLLDLAEQAQSALAGVDSPVIAAQLRSHDARESLNCIGCGLCSYVCPTRLPLTQQTLRLRGWVVTAEKK